MTGGNIRNIALAAAFLAADDGQRVNMSHLLRATQRELQKMGKIVAEGAFDRWRCAPETAASTFRRGDRVSCARWIAHG